MQNCYASIFEVISSFSKSLNYADVIKVHKAKKQTDIMSRKFVTSPDFLLNFLVNMVFSKKFNQMQVVQFRQVIILHNLANWVTFVFSLDIEHWQVKEHFSPLGHLWKSPRSRDRLRNYLRSPKNEVRQFSNLILSIDSPFKCDHFL